MTKKEDTVIVRLMKVPNDKKLTHVISLNGSKVVLTVNQNVEIPRKMYDHCIKGSYIEDRVAILG